MLTRPRGQSPRLDVVTLRGLISDRVEPVPTRVGRRGWSQRDQPHPSSVVPRGNPSRIGTFIPIAGQAHCKITSALHRMTKVRHRMTPEVHRIARAVHRMSPAPSRTPSACPILGLAEHRTAREVATDTIRSDGDTCFRHVAGSAAGAESLQQRGRDSAPLRRSGICTVTGPRGWDESHFNRKAAV